MKNVELASLKIDEDVHAAALAHCQAKGLILRRFAEDAIRHWLVRALLVEDEPVKTVQARGCNRAAEKPLEEK